MVMRRRVVCVFVDPKFEEVMEGLPSITRRELGEALGLVPQGLLHLHETQGLDFCTAILPSGFGKASCGAGKPEGGAIIRCTEASHSAVLFATSGSRATYEVPLSLVICCGGLP